MKALHVRLTSSKEQKEGKEQVMLREAVSPRKRFEQSFQKLNAARVDTLRKRGRQLRSQIAQKLCFLSAQDKLDELKSFEQGL